MGAICSQRWITFLLYRLSWYPSSVLQRRMALRHRASSSCGHRSCQNFINSTLGTGYNVQDLILQPIKFSTFLNLPVHHVFITSNHANVRPLFIAYSFYCHRTFFSFYITFAPGVYIVFLWTI